MRGGFPNGIPMIGGAPPGPAPIQVAMPMNDVQLIASLAVHMHTSLPVKEAVERAIAVVAESMRQLPTLHAKCREAQA